jgi:biotin carboxyl carrier protein
LKLRVEVDGEEYLLDLNRQGSEATYQLRGVSNESGQASGLASVVETQAGVYSVLLGNRSFEVRIANGREPAEVWAGQHRYLISQADARDSAGKRKGAAAVGPQEIRAQMPGKVIGILVAPGQHVEAGQGLIIVEAMKMQNEMRSPKDGVVSKIKAVAGATVAQGEVLMTVE